MKEAASEAAGTQTIACCFPINCALAVRLQLVDREPKA